MSERFKKATWFFFDLDDTLHEFRTASSAAVDATLHSIAEQHTNHGTAPGQPLTVAELKAEYIKVLKTKTAAAFVDGKTSHQYRAERFQGVMDTFNLSCTELQMQALLDTYETVITQHLKLKEGAIPLLQALKLQGKSIAIVTEGPQDSQERTVAALGLEPYCDRLITTNKLGIAKVNGLFGKALEALKLESGEVVMVGDSWERDIIPAAEARIECVWLAEKEKICKTTWHLRGEEKDVAVTVINSLGGLQSIMEETESC